MCSTSLIQSCSEIVYQRTCAIDQVSLSISCEKLWLPIRIPLADLCYLMENTLFSWDSFRISTMAYDVNRLNNQCKNYCICIRSELLEGPSSKWMVQASNDLLIESGEKMEAVSPSRLCFHFIQNNLLRPFYEVHSISFNS